MDFRLTRLDVRDLFTQRVVFANVVTVRARGKEEGVPTSVSREGGVFQLGGLHTEMRLTSFEFSNSRRALSVGV